MSLGPGQFLRYLPAIYNRQNDPFMGQFVSIFQKILTGLDDSQLSGRKGIQQLLAAEVVGNLFYPRFSFLFPDDHTTFIPPISGAPAAVRTALLTEFNSYIAVPVVTAPVNAATNPAPPPPDALSAFQDWLNRFLAWLGAMVDLTVEESWDIDKRRAVIARIMALYRLRGTPQGLGFLLNLLLDFPLTVTYLTVDHDGSTVTHSGQVTVTVFNPQPPGVTVTDTVIPGTTFMVQDTATQVMPLVSGYAPWRIDVTVVLPTATDQAFVLTAQTIQTVLALIGKLRVLLDAAKPAGTFYRLTVHPGIKLNDQAPPLLGQNTLLGS